jgi:glutathione S-transferase
MTAKLYSLPVSHPALAARSMLEHKAIAHRVVDLVPGTQPVLRALGFPGYTVPALVLGRRRIQGSREISRALEAVRPDPPLFPREPEARRRVEDAERWGEQVLQHVPRRIFRWAAAHDYGVRRWLAADVSGVPGGAVIARPRLQARAFARASGADDAAVRADIAALGDHLAEVERLRDAGVIGGERPNAADFQIASSLQSIAAMGDLAPYVAGHPAIRWAATVVPALPGPVPSALPREWLRPLEAARAPGV